MSDRPILNKSASEGVQHVGQESNGMENPYECPQSIHDEGHWSTLRSFSFIACSLMTVATIAFWFYFEFVNRVAPKEIHIGHWRNVAFATSVLSAIATYCLYAYKPEEVESTR
ncbi:MAG: hypothetical protein R3C03_23060 [Pirellulaceae bacterium]